MCEGVHKQESCVQDSCVWDRSAKVQGLRKHHGLLLPNVTDSE